MSLFRDETVDSFLARLAHANHLPIEELRVLLDVRILKKTPALALRTPLATVSGYTERQLTLVLPEFIDQKSNDTPGLVGRPLVNKRAAQRPACRHCAHRAGITSPVICWMTHDRNVCLRHQLWIGDSCQQPEDQIDVTALPGVQLAQRHHRNLITRHGRRWVSAAFPKARQIFLHWVQEHSADPLKVVESATSLLTDRAGRPPDEDVVLAVIFHPQIVNFAGLLACASWERKAAASGDILWLVQEITRRGILYGYAPRDRADPLIEWVESHFSLHRFAVVHGLGVYEALIPEETIRPTTKERRHPNRDHRNSPISPYLRY